MHEDDFFNTIDDEEDFDDGYNFDYPSNYFANFVLNKINDAIEGASSLLDVTVIRSDIRSMKATLLSSSRQS